MTNCIVTNDAVSVDISRETTIELGAANHREPQGQ